MQVSTRSVDVTYEAYVSVPLFDLARHNVEVLRALYERINPRFPISISDMQASGGLSFSDIKVQIALFGGRGTIALYANKFSATFTGAQNENDIKIIQDCINMSLDVLKSSFSDIGITSEILNSAMTLELLTEPKNASAFLSALTTPRIDLKPENIGATEIHQGFKLNTENRELRCNIFFDLARNVSEKNIMFFHAYASFDGATPLRSFDEKVNYYRGAIRNLLRSIGIVTEAAA